MNRRTAPTHARLWGFEVIDGCLQAGGRPLPEIVEEAGGTPIYIYDKGLISRRVAELRDALPEDVSLHYAVKANPMPGVVRHLTGLVDGFDVASAGEMRTVLDAGAVPTDISFAGPGKDDGELAAALAAGITVNVESEAELDRLCAIADQQGRRPRVALRINPDFELKSSGMKMAGGAKPFGIDAEVVPQLLGRLAGMDVEFLGFHIFCGSQNLSAEALIEAQSKTLELAASLARLAPGRVRMVNIGGGFGIPYFPGESHLDLEPVGTALAARLHEVRGDLPDAEIVIELGRYIVGEAGIYVCRVIDRKISRGRIFAVTDGGLHHHLAASGNFGQVLRKNYPVAIANKMGAPAVEEVDIVGRLCTPLDRLGDKVALPAVEVGDLIVLFQSGAYGLTASPTAFLSHPPPREVLV